MTVAMKPIAILGSTGSVGVTTLDVVSRFRDRFRVVALAAGRNLDLLVKQVSDFQPELVAVATPELAADLATRIDTRATTIVHGSEERDRRRDPSQNRIGDVGAGRSTGFAAHPCCY